MMFGRYIREQVELKNARALQYFILLLNSDHASASASTMATWVALLWVPSLI